MCVSLSDMFYSIHVIVHAIIIGDRVCKLFMLTLLSLMKKTPYVTNADKLLDSVHCSYLLLTTKSRGWWYTCVPVRYRHQLLLVSNIERWIFNIMILNHVFHVTKNLAMLHHTSEIWGSFGLIQ